MSPEYGKRRLQAVGCGFGRPARSGRECTGFDPLCFGRACAGSRDAAGCASYCGGGTFLTKPEMAKAPVVT